MGLYKRHLHICDKHRNLMCWHRYFHHLLEWTANFHMSTGVFDFWEHVGYPPSSNLPHLQTFSQNAICQPMNYVQLICYLLTCVSFISLKKFCYIFNIFVNFHWHLKLPQCKCLLLTIVCQLFNSLTHCLIVLYQSIDSEATSSRDFRISDALFPNLASTLCMQFLLCMKAPSAITFL